jgi:hypothetical protein
MKNKRILVFAAFIALALLGGVAWSAVAQDDDGLVSANVIPGVQAAVQAVNRSFPGIGQPDNFTYTFTEATTDSSLGCPLIEGFALERPVVPYRIVLFYGDRQYTYHASGDGTIVFPCDEALPIGGPLPPGRAPFTPATPAEAAIHAFLNSFPERGFPERFEFVILESVTDDSLLHCPSVEGGMVDASVVPYRVTLYSASVPYVYYVSADSSIVIACDL